MSLIAYAVVHAPLPAMTFDKNLMSLSKISMILWAITLCIIVAVQSPRLLSDPTPYPPETIENFTRVLPQIPPAIELAREIASHHLFGNASAKVSVFKAEPPEVPVPKTQLGLQLTGVFASEPTEHSAAVITAGGREQKTYRVGEPIDQQTTLEAVFPDHVLLRNRGALEKLELPGIR